MDLLKPSRKSTFRERKYYGVKDSDCFWNFTRLRLDLLPNNFIIKALTEKKIDTRSHFTEEALFISQILRIHLILRLRI